MSRSATTVPHCAALHAGYARNLAGKLKLDEMISRRIGLAEVNEAFAEMKRGAVARSVVVFEQ